MLNEELMKLKSDILTAIYSYQSLLNIQLGFSQQIDSLNLEYSNVQEQLNLERAQRNGLSVVTTKNRFVKFFSKIFSKKYKNDEVKYEELSNSIELLNDKLMALFKEIEMLKEEKISLDDTIKSYNISELEKELEQQEDRKQAIEMLLQKQPQLLEDVSFMKELIEESPQYIAQDRTDSEELYIKFCDICIANSAKEGDLQSAFTAQVAIKLKRELETPRIAEMGKYKIPHKYLFEGIKQSVNNDLSNGYTFSLPVKPILDYQELDGQLPEKYGRKIQKMYEDKDCYLLEHQVDINPVSNEQIKMIRKNICRNGLQCSGHSEMHVSTLPTTTIGNYQPEMSFLFALQPRNRIIMMIPKDAIDAQHKVPVWGADSPKIDFYGGQRNYVLPEYVVGYVDSKNQKFVDNPIPLSARKKYSYKFYEGEKHGIEVQYFVR